MQTLVRRRAAGRRLLVADLVLAVVIGFFGALAKRYLDFSLGIPGHAGVGWIAVLITGRLVVARLGMSTVAGVSMGLWGAVLGLGHSLGYNMLLYGMAGSLLDSGTLLRVPLRRAWGAAVAGTAVHLAKFGFVFANAWISGIVRRVEAYGLVAALGNHVLFGMAGGLLGWALWYGGRTVLTGRRAGLPS